MRTPTKHLKALRKALDEAEHLVDGVDKHIPKTSLERLKIRSYVLLTHAAIEEYIETLVLDVALEARNRFKKSGTISRALVSLISAKLIDDVKGKSKHKLSSDLVANIEIFSGEAYNRFLNEIKDNHGIKRQNQCRVFYPIGVDPEIEDSALMSTLDSYGIKRGDVAHNFHRITTELSLSDAMTAVKVIKRDIEIYDKAAVMGLRKRAL